MTRIFFIIAAVLISHASFSQYIRDSSALSSPIDTVNDRESIFTEAQKMPKIIGGVKSLEDTLSHSFYQQKPETNLRGLLYKLTITKEGAVRECELLSQSKNKTFARRLEALLKQTSGMWEPAWQNGRLVSATKFISINYKNGNFRVNELD